MNCRQKYIKPGFLEIYCGCMKSGKSKKLIERIDQLQYVPDARFKTFKPEMDTRDKIIYSRIFGDITQKCVKFNDENPIDLLNYITKKDELILFDEGMLIRNPDQFIEVIKYLLYPLNKNVIMAGAELDFRAEPFRPISDLLVYADHVEKLSAVCDYIGPGGKKCENIATRTQRLINGEPAHYNEPIFSVDDQEAKEIKKQEYQARCLEHHIVPGRPEKINIKYEYK